MGMQMGCVQSSAFAVTRSCNAYRLIWDKPFLYRFEGLVVGVKDIVERRGHSPQSTTPKRTPRCNAAGRK
jgi:hypothetical protein